MGYVNVFFIYILTDDGGGRLSHVTKKFLFGASEKTENHFLENPWL